MTMIWEVGVVIAALLTIAVAALFVPGIARVFLIAQVAYWSLSYVFRPIVLLSTTPVPQFADSLADPRLNTMGYDRAIGEVLKPVMFGLWFYAALVIAYAIFCSVRAHQKRVEVAQINSLGGRQVAVPTAPTTSRVALEDPYFFRSLGVVYGIGLLGRFVSFATDSAGGAGEISSANPLLDVAAGLATVGALGFIVFLRTTKPWLGVALLGALLGMELLWTVITESKTPVLGAALALAVRFALIGWTKGTIAGVIGIAISAVGAFGLLQSIKVDPASRALGAAADASYPESVQPFLSILRRFDLLEAATDAYFMQGREWISPGEVVRNAFLNFFPSQLLPVEKMQAGTAWANEVRGASVDMSQIQVSLAEGNIAEGYVLGGYLGVALTGMFVFGLLLITVRWILGRNLVLVVLGLTLIEFPVLFERGVLGGTELLGKSLQIAVLVWIISLLVGEFARRTDDVPPPTTYVPDDVSSLEDSAGRPHSVRDTASKGTKQWA